MKKLKLLFTVIIVAAAIVSCNELPWEDIVSLNVAPTLIKKTPKLYPGGNAECSTIGIDGLTMTTGRLNYNPATDSFDGSWPAGLLVKVFNETSVSFQIDGAIDLGDGKCYKVGAVIVKGGDASNVYDYTDAGGVTMDAGLVSPLNSSGSPAGLSNLTFCLIECKDDLPELVIAFKSTFSNGWVVTIGEGSASNVYNMGYLNYVYNPVSDENYKKVYIAGDPLRLFGNFFVRDYIDNADNKHYLEVVVDNSSWTSQLFTAPYLYVGSINGYNQYLDLLSAGDIKYYEKFPFTIPSETLPSPVLTFKIAFEDITE